MELKRLCFDAHDIESGVEVDDNDAFVCVCVCLVSGLRGRNCKACNSNR